MSDLITGIKPGDALLYRPTDLIGWLISVKTWSRACHIEIYAGGGKSFASRNGVGVGFYDYRTDSLGWVLRPRDALDLPAGRHWFFEYASGQKYDWLGLMCFYLAVKRGSRDRMFCSEFATRFYRRCGFRPFADTVDADTIAPAQFLQSPAFDLIWKK